MGRRDAAPNLVELRAVPRLFVAGASMEGPIELPQAELDKFRKVLRLGSGDLVALLPGDGTLIVARLQGRSAVPESLHRPNTEPELRVTVAQALPKGDKLDEIVRACVEIGVADFLLFAGDRSVPRWDPAKRASRLARLASIAREAAEVSFRTTVPAIAWLETLDAVLAERPEATVLSEAEGLVARLKPADGRIAIVVGPEGGWSPREASLAGSRAVTLGPRVLRVDHAAAAAAAVLLLGG